MSTTERVMLNKFLEGKYLKKYFPFFMLLSKTDIIKCNIQLSRQIHPNDSKPHQLLDTIIGVLF